MNGGALGGPGARNMRETARDQAVADAGPLGT